MKTFLAQRILFAILVLNLALAAYASVGFAAQKKPSPTDVAIVDQVRIKLAGDDIVKGGAITVDCRFSVVTLGGAVETDKQKARAERLTRKVKGVKQVVNNLTVRTR